MVIQDVQSSLLKAVLRCSRRRWEVGSASPTEWTIFMDPCRQNFVKWSRTAFRFDWKHYYEELLIGPCLLLLGEILSA